MVVEDLRFNWLLDPDPKLRKAGSPHGFRSGQRQRWAA